MIIFFINNHLINNIHLLFKLNEKLMSMSFIIKFIFKYNKLNELNDIICNIIFLVLLILCSIIYNNI